VSVVAAILEYLGDQEGVSDLVDDRLFDTDLPQRVARPNIVAQLISDPDIAQHMTAGGGLHRARIQLVMRASNGRDLQRVCDAVYAEMHGHPGDTIGGDDVETHVRSIRLEDAGKLPSEADAGGQATVHVHRQDYMVTYRRTVPTFS